jgi:hypothetical protein
VERGRGESDDWHAVLTILNGRIHKERGESKDGERTTRDPLSALAGLFV